MNDDVFRPYDGVTTATTIPLKYDMNDGDMVAEGSLAWNTRYREWGVSEMTFRWETPVPIEYFPDAVRAFADLVRQAAQLHVNQLPVPDES